MKLGQVAVFSDFWRVVRDFNPEGIEREAAAPLRIWVVGEPGSGRRTLIASLTGEHPDAAMPGPFSIQDLADVPTQPDPDEADAVILVVRADGELAEAGRRASALLARAKVPVLLVVTHADTVEATRDLRNAIYRVFSFVSHLRTLMLDARNAREVHLTLAPLLLETMPALRMALARQVHPLRDMVAQQLIADTCKVNAQFALVANIPANIPFIGGFAGNVADFFVLTKNQVMMVFRLAAIYGRDIAPTGRVMAEIAPVIGGGLAWRTAARMLVGMFPTLLAAAPKMAIAYVGTYVAGQAARYYYDEGRRPPRHLLERFGAEGSKRFRDVLARKELQPDSRDVKTTEE
jgi:uncharacterized protein (DUF697 family)